MIDEDMMHNALLQKPAAPEERPSQEQADKQTTQIHSKASDISRDAIGFILIVAKTFKEYGPLDTKALGVFASAIGSILPLSLLISKKWENVNGVNTQPQDYKNYTKNIVLFSSTSLSSAMLKYLLLPKNQQDYQQYGSLAILSFGSFFSDYIEIQQRKSKLWPYLYFISNLISACIGIGFAASITLTRDCEGENADIPQCPNNVLDAASQYNPAAVTAIVLTTIIATWTAFTFQQFNRHINFTPKPEDKPKPDKIKQITSDFIESLKRNSAERQASTTKHLWAAPLLLSNTFEAAAAGAPVLQQIFPKSLSILKAWSIITVALLPAAVKPYFDRLAGHDDFVVLKLFHSAWQNTKNDESLDPTIETLKEALKIEDMPQDPESGTINETNAQESHAIVAALNQAARYVVYNTEQKNRIDDAAPIGEEQLNEIKQKIRTRLLQAIKNRGDVFSECNISQMHTACINPKKHEASHSAGCTAACGSSS